MNAWFHVDGAWQLAGWTMLHFLWIGAAAGVLGAALRIACRRAAPGVRYAVSLGTLAVIAALPVGIAGWLAGRGDAVSTVAHSESRRDSATRSGVSPNLRIPPTAPDAPPQVIDLAKTPIVNSSPTPAPSEPGRLGPGVAAIRNPSPDPSAPRPLFNLQGRGILDATVAYLPWVWIVGAPLTFVLLAAGLVGSKRLRSASTLLDSGPAAEACARLRGLMHITRRVLVAVSDAVAQPVLVGIVRPTILLPAAALSGWSPEELEMVLLHELAHVRRWDNLVNLVQRIVESLLFFHPAVWLASRQVRRDREECCDAAVVRHTERPAEYAELLVAIAGRARHGRGAGTRSAEAGLALASAMADHPLAGRIRRILKLEDESMHVSRSTLGVALAATAALFGAVLFIPTSNGAQAVEKAIATKQEVNNKKLVPPPDDLAHLGDTPAATAALKALFETSDKNPLETRTYSTEKLPRRLDMKLDDQFANMQRDPFGPRLKFEFESIADGKEYRITAPVQAQRKYFSLMFSGRLAELSRLAVAREAVIPAANAAPANVIVAPSASWTEIQGTYELPIGASDIRQDITRIGKALADQGVKPVFETHMANDGQPSAVFRLLVRDGKPRRIVWEESPQGITPRVIVAEDKYPGVPAPMPAAQQGPVPDWAVAAPAPSQRAGRKLQPGDRVGLDVVGAPADRPLSGTFQIEPEGTLALGAAYGRVSVADHTVLEAESLIKEQLRRLLTGVEVQLVLIEPSHETPVVPQPIISPYPTPATGARVIFPASTAATGWSSPPPVGARTIGAGGPYGAPIAQRETKLSAKEQEIEQKLSTPVKLDFLDQPLSDVVAVLSDTADVNIYIDPRGVEEEGVDDDQPVTLSLPHEISVKSALKLVLEPLHLTYVIKDEVVKITSETARDRAAAAQTPTVPTTFPVRSAWEQKADDGATIITPAFPKPTYAAPATTADPNSAAPPADSTSAQKTRYLYDGKEFAQWRSLWQEELKTERRMEAIEALAAFGRAGYGREAVEAVFDVAGQYDFSTMDQSPEGKLKTRVIELLTSYGATRLPETVWLPVLEQRLNAEPARWKWLAYWLLSSLQTSDAAVMEKLFELAKSEDDDIRAGAIAAIGKSDRKREDPRIIEMAEKFLGSSNPREILNGILLLEYSPNGNSANVRFRFRPAVFDALFFDDENVRLTARRALRNIDAKEAAPVVEQLMARLKASEANDERLAALRAIAALGPKASTAESALTAMIEDFNDLELAAAAAVAVDQLHDGESKDGSVYNPGRDLYYKRIQALGEESELKRGNYLFNKESIDVTNSLRNVNLGSGGGFF